MINKILDYARKLSGTDKKSLSEKALKTAEEVGELAKVVLPYDLVATTKHRFVTNERILEEVADVILCALSIAYHLKYSDDEIASMMFRKAAYWEELQHREEKITFPLPYEIHVTVAANGAKSLDEFKAACQRIGVKPLLIDLHNQMGETIMLDSQTSSVHMGDNTSVLAEVERIASELANDGFLVLRKKVETVPWHPAAPSDAHKNPHMPKDCYFEAHFNVLVDDAGEQRLRDLVKEEELPIHISRNAFKKISDNERVMMGTYRLYEGTYEDFKRNVDHLASAIRADGFVVPKTITEFSIYDTKIDHDSNWISLKD